jgi:molybdopterin-guanine dinucleotide biosynthesis protein A
MERDRRPVTGVILAGGKSSRMGQNKALMPFGGQRLIDRVVDVLQEVFTDLLLVTNSPEVYADLGLPLVSDVYPHKGSLGGIYSALYHASTPYCFVVACDMPFLNAAVMRYMVGRIAGCDVVMPDIHGEMQPLHAIYSKACLPPILRRLETHRLKIVGFLSEVRVRIVKASDIQHLDPALLTFHNLNTREEFQAAAQRLSLSHGGRSV